MPCLFFLFLFFSHLVKQKNTQSAADAFIIVDKKNRMFLGASQDSAHSSACKEENLRTYYSNTPPATFSPSTNSSPIRHRWGGHCYPALRPMRPYIHTLAVPCQVMHASAAGATPTSHQWHQWPFNVPCFFVLCRSDRVGSSFMYFGVFILFCFLPFFFFFVRDHAHA